MSAEPETIDERLDPGTRALIARAAGADARARLARARAIEDAFVAHDARLDDRTHSALGSLIGAMMRAIEGELIEHSARLLTTRGHGALVDLLTRQSPSVLERLAGAGLLRDDDFVAECVARLRLELIAAALPFATAVDGEAPSSLLARLSQSADGVVAAAAASVMIGKSHRRSVAEGGSLASTGLPHVLHARLVWWVAAALRDRVAGEARDISALDRALAESALRNLAAQDDHDRLEAAAMRLAQAVDAHISELPALIDESLRDRRLVVLVAFLAHALGVEFDLARELVVDPAGDRLWLVLRALDMPRNVIARIGFLLCEADPRRDVEAFADTLDVAAGIDPETASIAIAPLRLHPDYRAAVLALEFGKPR